MEKEHQDQVRIVLLGDGPMIVQGDFLLRQGDQPLDVTQAEREAGITLCRCGRSQSMPRCDGAHLNKK